MVSRLKDAVLDVFKRENRELAPQEVARLAGLNANTTRRIIHELAKAHHLKKVQGTRKYTVGSATEQSRQR